MSAEMLCFKNKHSLICGNYTVYPAQSKPEDPEYPCPANPVYSGPASLRLPH